MSDHHNHSHDNNIKWAFFLNFGFTIIEIFGGFWTNSISILTDALHDLGDSISIGLAWALSRFSKKGRDTTYSYGYRRFSLLGAMINILVLLGGSIFVLSKSIPRIINPEVAHAPGMLAFAVLGITINGIAALRMRRDHSLNSRIVFLHLLEDVLGWIGVLVVSIVLLFTDWYILDALFSLFITLYILVNVIRNLKKTLALFMQAIPEGLPVNEIENRLKTIEHVESCHHTHSWSLDGEKHVLSTHVVVGDSVSKDEVIQVKCAIRRMAQALHFEHITVETEYANETCSMHEKEDHDCLSDDKLKGALGKDP